MYLESCWVPCDLCRDWLEAKHQEMPPWLPARTEVMPPLRQSAEDGDDPEPAAPRNATRHALDRDIHLMIAAVYDHANSSKMKPPNLKEIADPVIRLLRARGLAATKNQIAALAADERHRGRRLPPGPRVNSTFLPFSDPEM